LNALTDERGSATFHLDKGAWRVEAFLPGNGTGHCGFSNLTVIDLEEPRTVQMVIDGSRETCRTPPPRHG
jgi:hypothetical protein